MKIKSGFVAVLLGTFSHASAQSILEGKKQEDLSIMLNEVVVTGTGTEHYLKDAPVQTEVITRKALEQFQARSVEDLLSVAAEQNFVPVVDDKGAFIGIVTRSSILKYFQERFFPEQA